MPLRKVTFQRVPVPGAHPGPRGPSCRIVPGQRGCSKRVRSTHSASSQVAGRIVTCCRSQRTPRSAFYDAEWSTDGHGERASLRVRGSPGAEVRWVVGQPSIAVRNQIYTARTTLRGPGTCAGRRAEGPHRFGLAWRWRALACLGLPGCGLAGAAPHRLPRCDRDHGGGDDQGRSFRARGRAQQFLSLGAGGRLRAAVRPGVPERQILPRPTSVPANWPRSCRRAPIPSSAGTGRARWCCSPSRSRTSLCRTPITRW